MACGWMDLAKQNVEGWSLLAAMGSSLQFEAGCTQSAGVPESLCALPEQEVV